MSHGDGIAELELVTIANSDPARALEIVGSIEPTNEQLTPAMCRAAAIAHRVLGQLDHALTATDEGIRRADATSDHRSSSLCRVSSAPILAQLGRLGEAMSRLDESEAHLRGVDLAELRFQRAGVHGLVADYRLAIDDYSKALPTFRRHGIVSWQADTLMNRGLMRAYLGDTTRAKNDLSAAAELFEAEGDKIGVGAALHNRALASLMGGESVEALDEFERSDRILAANGFPVDLFATDHCEALLAVGLRTEAIELGLRGIRALEAAGNTLEAATQRLVLARALRQNSDHGAALRQAKAAQAAFAAQGQRHRVLAAELTVLYTTLQSGGDPHTVRVRANEIARYFSTDVQMPEWAGHALLIEAQAALACGDLSDVERLLTRHRRQPSFAQEVQRATLGARLEDARGRPGPALRATRRGLRRVEHVRDQAPSPELHDALSHHMIELRDVGLTQLLDAGRGRAAFEFAERLDRTRAELVGSNPSSSFVEYRALGRAIADAENERRDPGPLERRRRELERRIRSEQSTRPDANSSDTTPTTPASDAIVSRLVVNRDRVWSLDSIRGRVRCREVGRFDEISAVGQELTFRHRRAVAGGAADPVIPELAEHLDITLGRPGTVGSSASVLNLIPDNALIGLPFGLLPSLTSRPWAFSLHGSAPRAGPSRRPGGRVVVVAGPDLATSASELEQLRGIHPNAEFLHGADATGDAVRSACEGANLVHIAAHSTPNVGNPMFSAIRLADGDITVHAFRSLARPPARLVLATCSSAVTTSIGLTAVGLSTSLIRAGVDGVVGTICDVPDDPSTTGVMARLHENDVTRHAAAVRDVRIDGSLSDSQRLVAAALAASTPHPIAAAT